MYVWFCLHPVRAFFLFFDVVCVLFYCFFFLDTPPTEIYTYLHTLSLHDALPISKVSQHRSAHHGRSTTFPTASRRSSIAKPSRQSASSSAAWTCGRILPAAASASIAATFSAPRSGKRRPYSPARTPTTENPLISGMLTDTSGIRPDAKPKKSRRPPKRSEEHT